jgi:thermosome
MKEGSNRSRGQEAQHTNIAAAKLIAEIVKSSLGPKGMDKMLVDSFGDVTITSDGRTILDEMDIQHPAAKMMLEVAKTQDNEAGDGTTTAVIVSGELLNKAEELIEKGIHPTIVIDGYKKAAEKALETLEKIAIPTGTELETYAKKAAITSMASKLVAEHREYLAELAVKAVVAVAEKEGNKYKVDLDDIKVEKKPGESTRETKLIQGIVLDKEVSHSGMPKRVEKAKIALLDAPLEIEKTEFDAKINIESPEQMKMFLDEEERIMREMVDQIAKSGATVLLSEKSIDDLVVHFLAKKGIMAVKSVSSSDMEKLAKATGGQIMASPKDLTAEVLGHAKTVEEVKIGDDKLLYIRECKNPKAVTIVIRGGTEHVIDEAERSLHDALCVVRNVVEDGKIVAGGGSPEAEVSKKLREFAVKVGGREQLAIEAFAEAVEAVPLTLAENAGLDPIDIMVALRAKHEDAEGTNFGIDAASGKVKNMLELKVVEPLRVKLQVIKSATEAANMILKIDDLIASKGGGKGPPMPQGGMPPGAGGMGGMGGMPPY